jgi:hypothetical protein
MFLADDIFVEVRHEFTGERQALKVDPQLFASIVRVFLEQDALAQFNAVIADEHPIGSRDQTFNLVVTAPAE